MPRCGVDFKALRPSGNTTDTISVTTSTAPTQLSGAIILQVLRGEWHPISIDRGEVVMDTSTQLLYPAMDLVVQWPPNTSSSGAKLFIPANVSVDSRARSGLGSFLGINSGNIATYTSSSPNASSQGVTLAWEAFSCLLGDKLPDGTPLTEVILSDSVSGTIRGGWVFIQPDPNSETGGPGTPENGVWLTLPANRFAILGGSLGALFGSGRRLFFESGVSSSFKSAVRSEFGFGSTDGEDAYIRVMDFGDDFLLEVTPE